MVNALVPLQGGKHSSKLKLSFLQHLFLPVIASSVVSVLQLNRLEPLFASSVNGESLVAYSVRQEIVLLVGTTYSLADIGQSILGQEPVAIYRLCLGDCWLPFALSLVTCRDRQTCNM
jgi:hypothetical protein